MTKGEYFENEKIRLDNPAFLLAVEYGRERLKLGRTFTEEELEKYRRQDCYNEEFEQLKSGLDKFFMIYERAKKEGRANLGMGTLEDQLAMLEWTLDDIKKEILKGGKPARFKEELAVRMFNIIKNLEQK